MEYRGLLSIEGDKAKFTQRGKDKLQSVSILAKPERVLELRSDVALADQSPWALCERLREQGWVLKPLPARIRRGMLELPLGEEGSEIPDADKNIYFRRPPT